MSKLAKLSILGATSAVVCMTAGSAALAGPVGLADANSVAMPTATESVHYRGRSAYYHGRSAYYCPPGRRVFIERRTAYVPRDRYIIERRTAYVPRTRYIIERRTAYVVPTTTIVRSAAPVYADYPGYGYPYGYGYGGPGIIGAGAGLLGGALNVGFGGGWGGPGWGGPGWGGGWGWRRSWW